MKKIILFIACLLFGLSFINSGLNKFFNYMPVPEDMPERPVKMFMAMMEISWLMPLVAVVEIIGGALFIVKRTRALAAIMLCPILVGIILIHSTVLPDGLPMVAVFVAIYLWVVIENREKYLPMVRA